MNGWGVTGAEARVERGGGSPCVKPDAQPSGENGMTGQEVGLTARASTRVTTWRELIDFEEQAPPGRRAKAQAIRREFKWTTGRYWWELYHAIDRHMDEAMRYAPMTVTAILRARDQGRVRRGLSGDAA